MSAADYRQADMRRIAAITTLRTLSMFLRNNSMLLTNSSALQGVPVDERPDRCAAGPGWNSVYQPE